ncbi:hypothetical protein HO173_006282 [Letharia columbiana]|uniref:Uncharacterized protein n=1 Tax=Letharia columbiana TaxID=112416 RepID=A0A8H6FVN4_9LECA|nr:uncharacterized protein HO173_006282 [Letharia columbiana]KAF6235599.1 hypothetical protein HO173_006282 [Letharia columbiana]
MASVCLHDFIQGFLILFRHSVRRLQTNLLDAFVVELAERQNILMPPGTNNDSANRTQRMATASAIVNKITGQNWANETKLSLPIVRT